MGDERDAQPPKHAQQRVHDHLGLLAGELVQRGKPGGSYVRIRRQNVGDFRRTRSGYLVATQATESPRNPVARRIQQARDLLIGRPLPSEAIESEKMSVFKALPILSSDALSSVAYGPEAALAVLAVAGAGAFIWNVPIAIAVALLMLIVTISYRQVIRGYQGGGGSYAVARANLGVILGLVAGSALLVDYVLTVSVSVSSGVDALLSAFAGLLPYRIPLLLGLVGVLLLGNLRGVREAGLLFAVPTYVFVVAILALIAAGLVRAALGGAPHPGQYPPLPAHEAVTPLLVLAAFASGCSSMTGIEAVSNGVPAFKEPRTDNAMRTLAVLGGLLIVLFIGVEVLGVIYTAEPHPLGTGEDRGRDLGEHRGIPWAYYAIQFATTLVLVLAANTSFAGFPRLCAILARDDFLPHRFGQLGKRLVYSGAMVFLALTAAALMLAFQGNTDALINLFALGVFTAFSLAQTAMARQWWTRRGPGWRRGLAINGLGATVTALVDVVIIATKSPRGAWVVVVLIPLLVLFCWSIHRYYVQTRSKVASIGVTTAPVEMGPVVVPLLRQDQAAADALGYARLLGGRLVVLQASAESPRGGFPEGAEVRRLPTGGRLRSVLGELDAIRRDAAGAIVTVVLPDEAREFWVELLVRPDLVWLKLALLRRENVVAASCPGFLEGRGSRPASREAEHVLFVPVAGLDAVTVNALRYARAMSPEVVAVHVVSEIEERGSGEQDDLPDRFNRWASQLEGDRPHLVVIESPYRSVVPPLVSYVLQWRASHPGRLCTAVVPELVDERLRTLWLHNHRAFWLKTALLHEPGIGVIDVTLHIGDENPSPLQGA